MLPGHRRSGPDCWLLSANDRPQTPFGGRSTTRACGSVQKLGRPISSGHLGVRHGCTVCSVRWSVPATRCCADAFAVTRCGYLERRDAAGREFAVQNRDPDLRHAVRPFVSPAHLSLLGHAVADDLIHRGLGDAAADRQALAMPRAVVDQRVRVIPPVGNAPGSFLPVRRALGLPWVYCAGTRNGRRQRKGPRG